MAIVLRHGDQCEYVMSITIVLVVVKKIQLKMYSIGDCESNNWK